MNITPPPQPLLHPVRLLSNRLPARQSLLLDRTKDRVRGMMWRGSCERHKVQEGRRGVAMVIIIRDQLLSLSGGRETDRQRENRDEHQGEEGLEDAEYFPE
jgi:hypothetical protein